MRGRLLDLKSAAEHALVDENELKHCAQRGEIESVKRGDDWYFEHRTLDEWAQRNLLASSKKDVDVAESALTDRRRRATQETFSIADLFPPSGITLDLRAKAKAGAIRDMTDLAVATGLVYDDEGLYAELVAREDAAPTAVGMGAAFLHPRYHDPYFFEETFIGYGRAQRPIFFGAPDGEGTRHFFIVCSTDHETHLHILARLAVLAHGTNLLERLDAATAKEDVTTAIRECEEEYAK